MRQDAWSLIVRTIFLLLGIGLALVFLWFIHEIVALVLLAAVAAAALAPAAYWINQFRFGPKGWRIPTVFGVLLVYIGLIVILIIISSLVFPPVIDNLQGLILAAPRYFADAEAIVEQLRGQYPWIPEIQIDQSLIIQVTNQIRAYLPTAFSIFFGVLNTIFDAFFVLILALYITLEAPHIRDFVLRLVPRSQRQHVLEVTNEIAWRTGRWAGGQLVLATVVALAWVVGLLIIGIPFPFALAFVAFVGELVPMVGPIITGVIAAGVALTTSPLQFGLTIALAILVQQLENNLLVPRIVGTAVGISPLTVILALLIGGSLMGFIGAILAVPVAAALQVLVGRLVAIHEEEVARREKELALTDDGIVEREEQVAAKGP